MPDDMGVKSTTPDATQIFQDIQGDPKKKIGEQERSTQIQKHTQQEQKQAQESSQKESKLKGEESYSSQAKRSYSQGTAQKATKGSEAMDGFLKRTSQQTQQREAGKQMSRPETLSSHSIQSWTVGQSRHTPPPARQFIMAKQQDQQNGANQKSGSFFLKQNTAGKNLPQHRTWSSSQGPQMLYRPSTQGKPQIFQYGKASPFFQKTPQGLIYSRGQNNQNVFRQTQALIQNQSQNAKNPYANPKAQVLVHIRGPFVFVKDEKKLRAFKLNQDGTFSELNGEEDDNPLSPQARTELRRVLREKGIQTRLEQEDAEAVAENQEADDLAEASASNSPEGELDFESQFALLLHKILEEEGEIGEELEGDPEFPDKKDWASFFANMLQAGSKEKSESKDMDKMLSMLFRGLFQKKDKAKFLVGDLKYLKGNKARQEKFAQIPIKNEKLLALLQNLKPGQNLDKEMLQKAFGENLSYLKMAHAFEKKYQMAGEAAKNVKFNPKANTDLYGQAKLEYSLREARRQNEKLETKADPLPPAPKGIFANVYELLNSKERYDGKPRFWVFVTYAFIGLSSLALITWVLSQVL